MMKTFSAKEHEVRREWLIVDASGQALGRMVSRIAMILRGKHKPEYTPHVDTGDYVIVINASQVRVSGNKEKDKIYYHHTGYPGGIKAQSFDKKRESDPESIIHLAVKGMLPRGPLGRAMAKKLKVYPDSNHLHEAQQPRQVTLDKPIALTTQVG